MKCEFCNHSIDNNPINNKFGKSFCSDICKENCYVQTINDLKKSEKAWHNEWFNMRDIVGRLGLEIMELKNKAKHKAKQTS